MKTMAAKDDFRHFVFVLNKLGVEVPRALQTEATQLFWKPWKFRVSLTELTDSPVMAWLKKNSSYKVIIRLRDLSIGYVEDLIFRNYTTRLHILKMDLSGAKIFKLAQLPNCDTKTLNNISRWDAPVVKCVRWNSPLTSVHNIAIEDRGVSCRTLAQTEEKKMKETKIKVRRSREQDVEEPAPPPKRSKLQLYSFKTCCQKSKPKESAEVEARARLMIAELKFLNSTKFEGFSLYPLPL
jgi:hypothetical protein